MKYIAKQVPPEFQDPHLMLEYFENLAICGNPRLNGYKSHTFEAVEEVLDDCDLYEMLTDADELAIYYDSKKDAILHYLSPVGRDTYTNDEFDKLEELVVKYCDIRPAFERDIMCEIMTIVMGDPWNYHIIRGSSQSDWNYIFYGEGSWSDEDIRQIECEYFNEGSEWIVSADGGDIGDSVYCVNWNDKGIRKEIADYMECEHNQIKMLRFTGYKKIPQYEEVAL